MFDSLKPDMRYRSVRDIDIEKLKSAGIKGLLIDLDNTLAPWRSDDPPTENLEWLDRAKEAGIKVCLLSNAGNARAERTAAKLSVPVLAPAKKPLRSAYLKALEITGTKAGETVMVGDQLFMDVLGANRAGIKTILVEPIGRREFSGTRLVRIVEKIILKL